jgi:hypothetical protein
MYSGDIIEVFISSPADVVQERKIIHNLIEEWNIINTRRKKQILRPISWEKDLYSSFGESAQSIINRQILDEADILIGIFNARLGTPTKDYNSGSVEERIRHVDKNKPAMLYFSNENIDRNSFDIEQFNKLNEFKNWCKDKSVFFEYKDMNDFSNKVRTQIGLLLNDSDYFNSVKKNEQTGQFQKIPQKQKDIIQFLSRLSEFKDNNKLSDYINEIGDFRFRRILPVLKQLDILNADQTLDGTFHVVILHGFSGYSKKDIENIIDAITNGEIDI